MATKALLYVTISFMLQYLFGSREAPVRLVHAADQPCNVPPPLHLSKADMYQPVLTYSGIKGQSSFLVGKLLHHALLVPQDQNNSASQFLLVASQIRNYGGSVILINSYKASISATSSWDVRLPDPQGQQVATALFINDLLGSECDCALSANCPFGVTADPSNTKLVFFGFGLQCVNNLIIWQPAQTTLIPVQQGHHVPLSWASLASISLINTTTHIANDYLISFGGSLQTSAQPHADNRFRLSNNIWRCQILHKGPSNDSDICYWEILSTANTSGELPSPRAMPALFTLNNSLLVYGGLATRNQTDLDVILCDFWIFHFTSHSWYRLQSNLDCSRSSESNAIFYIPTSAQATQATLMRDMNILVVFQWSYSSQERTLHACKLQLPSSVTCRLLTTDRIARPYIEAQDLYMLASSGNNGYIISAGTRDSYQFHLQPSMDFGGHFQCTISTQVSQNDATIRQEFPGNLGCLAAAPVFAQGLFTFFGSCVRGDNRGADHSRPFASKTAKVPPMAVWQLNIRDFVHILLLNYPVPGPLQRDLGGHTATLLTTDTVVLYGGFTSNMDDMSGDNSESKEFNPWCFKLSSLTWQEAKLPSQQQSVPVMRSHHVAFRHNETSFVIYGGLSTSYRPLADVWIFVFTNLSSCAGGWSELTHQLVGSKLPPRMFHSATVYDEGFTIFYGGEASNFSLDEPLLLPEYANADYDGSLAVLHLSPSLQRAAVYYIPIKPIISPRTRHSLTFYTNQDLLLLGGKNSNRTESGPLPQQALLLRIKKEDGKFLTKARPFFNFSVAKHHVVASTLFSGNPFPYENYVYFLGESFIDIQNTLECPLVKAARTTIHVRHVPLASTHSLSPAHVFSVQTSLPHTPLAQLTVLHLLRVHHSTAILTELAF